jgi:lysozyme
LSLTAYWDVSRWSIGYGTQSFEGETITPEEAERRLQEKVEWLFDRISKKCPECTTNQLASLISFTYNVGLGNLLRSSLFRYTLAGEHEKAAKEFRKWVSAGGEKLEGLKKRREKERRVYLGEGIKVPAGEENEPRGEDTEAL